LIPPIGFQGVFISIALNPKLALIEAELFIGEEAFLPKAGSGAGEYALGMTLLYADSLNGDAILSTDSSKSESEYFCPMVKGDESVVVLVFFVVPRDSDGVFDAVGVGENVVVGIWFVNEREKGVIVYGAGEAALG
jgi:hypothetical protein